MATLAVVRKVFELILAPAYPNQKIADPGKMIESYTAGLLDIDNGVLVDAAELAKKTGRWFPTVADLRDAAQRVQQARQYGTVPK